MNGFLLDSEEFQLLRAGDPSIYDEVYRRWEESVYTMFCRQLKDRPESEDAKSEVLTSLWENRSRFKNALHLKHWMYLVISNKCIDRMKRRRRRTVPLVEEMHVAFDDQDVLEAIVAKEMRGALFRSVGGLPDRCKEACQLRFVDGVSRKDIAVRMKIAPKTVSEHMGKGVEKIYAIMEKLGYPVKKNKKKQLSDQE